MPSQSTTSLDY
jgi:hypothetical protein